MTTSRDLSHGSTRESKPFLSTLRSQLYKGSNSVSGDISATSYIGIALDVNKPTRFDIDMYTVRTVIYRVLKR